MSTEILPDQSALDEVLTAPPRYAPRPQPRRASRSKPAMPMARCAACDAPNVDDRDTCWRCLQSLDADAEPVRANPVAVVPPAEPAMAPAEPVVVPAKPSPAAAQAAVPPAQHVLAPARPAPATPAAQPASPGPVAVTRPTAIRVTPWEPVPSREVRLSARVNPGQSLSPWPYVPPRRRSRGRSVAIASIALFLVISIAGVAGVALLGLGSTSPNDPAGDADSSSRDLLAAAPVASSPTPEPTATPRPTRSPVAEPTMASEPQTDVPAALAAAVLTGRQPEPAEAEVSRVPATQAAVSPEGTATTSEPVGRAPRGNAFMCGDTAPPPIRDLRDRTWEVTKVSFRPMPGFERVILHLYRIGDARQGDRTVAIAGRVSTKQLSELPSDVHPERQRRGLLRIALPGVPEGPELRAFRPLGIGNVGELSLLPGRKGRTALLAIDHDACYRIRVPEWGPAGSDDARRAEVVIDIRD